MNSNFNYQKLAVEKLSKLRAGALFMKMGTGKTKVALDLIKTQQHLIDIVIWIAPASLIREENYKNEIKKWSSGLEKEIKFFTIEGVSASDNKYLEMYNLAKENKCFCVVDESITIKNTEAGRTKRLLDIYDLFTFRLILNGTPLTQGLIDLYSQIKFIHPKILNMTEVQFANNFLTYKKGGYKPWKRWSSPENEQALIEIIRPYIFDAELDIPTEIKYKDICFNLSTEELLNYDAEKYAFLDGKVQVNFLATAQKFQHIYTNCSEKKKYLLKLLNEIKERKEKVIIYIKFIDEIYSLLNDLDAVIFTGFLKNDLKKFEKEKDILICTYGVGSMGLNLQFCNNIIYYSQTFDYKDKVQSMHRIYRIGQTKNCNIYNFWVNTGLEKIIKKSLDKKTNVLDNVEKIISKEKALKL